MNLYPRKDLGMIGDKAKYAVDLSTNDVYVNDGEGNFTKSVAHVVNMDGDIVPATTEALETLAQQEAFAPARGSVPSAKVDLRRDNFY